MVTLKRMALILTLAVAGAWSFACKGDHVLFWMLDDPGIEAPGYPEIKHVSDLENYGRTVDSARIVATKGSDTIYLDLYYQDGSQWVLDPTANPRIDTAGVTSGKIDGGYARASLESTLGSDYALYSFAVELGTWGGQNGSEWLLAAYSDSESYANLQQYVSFQVDIPTAMRWEASGFVAVPEPSSGLLILLGGALLALRRKRGGV